MQKLEKKKKTNRLWTGGVTKITTRAISYTRHVRNKGLSLSDKVCSPRWPTLDMAMVLTFFFGRNNGNAAIYYVKFMLNVYLSLLFIHEIGMSNWKHIGVQTFFI